MSRPAQAAVTAGIQRPGLTIGPGDEVPRVPGRISRVALPLPIEPQPTETTCGATCLHATYRYWHDDDTLHDVIARMHSLEHGGTFAVYLACDALRKSYSATIDTYNLLVFDPTWFEEGVDIARSRSVCRR